MTEFIVKRLMERRKEYILEMATSWSDIKRELGSSVTKEILIHLIKLYYWSDIDKEDPKHWKEEIYSFYHDIPKQKSNNKFPPSNKIYQVIWDSWGDTFDSIEYLLNKEYDKFPSIKIEDKAIEFCNEYIKWLSERLSIKGVVTKSEVLEEIDGLLLEYNLKED